MRSTSNPPGYTASDRRALRSVAVQFFVNGAVLGSVLARFPEIRDQVDISLATFGLIATLASGARLLGSTAAPHVIGRFGTRRTLVVGTFILISALLVVGVASTPIALWCGLGLMAFVDVIVDVAMNLQASWLSARRPAPIMNRVHGLWSLGTLLGGATAAMLARLEVPLMTHLVAAVATLYLVLIYVGRGLLATDEASSRAPDAAGTLTPTGRWPLVLFALAGAGAVAVESIPNDWSALRFSDDLGASPGVAGLAFVAMATGMTAGRFVGDAAIGRLGRDRTILVSTIIAAAGFSLAGFAGSTPTATAGFALTGLGVATFFPTIYDDAAQHPGRTGAALGALTFGASAIALLLPAAIGAVADTSWSVGATIAAFGLAALGALTAARQAM